MVVSTTHGMVDKIFQSKKFVLTVLFCLTEKNKDLQIEWHFNSPYQHHM